MNICKLNKDACQASFECEWIVGKGCRPRKGAIAVPNASINFTDLPPDVKKLISSKLTGKNAAAFKATNKENRANIPKVQFTEEDFISLAVKPYAKQVMSSLKPSRGGKTYRDYLMIPYNQVTVAKNRVIDNHVNAIDTSHLHRLSKVMGKSGRSIELEVKRYVKEALDNAPHIEYEDLPKKPKETDLKKIKSMEELKDYIQSTVVNDYSSHYWYAQRELFRKYKI
jgi:hypothetical protein